MNSVNHRAFGQGGQKERGARQPHKRLLHYLNVNRTSLDHLLLGKNADVDKSVECSEYSAGRRCQTMRFLYPLGLGGADPKLGLLIFSPQLGIAFFRIMLLRPRRSGATFQDH